MGAKIYDTASPKIDHCIGYVDDDGTITSVANLTGFVDARTGKVYDSSTPNLDHCIGCAAEDGKLYRDSVPSIGKDIGFVSSDGTIYRDNTPIVGHWIGYVDSASILGRGGACFFILKGLLGKDADAEDDKPQTEKKAGTQSAKFSGKEQNFRENNGKSDTSSYMNDKASSNITKGSGSFGGVVRFPVVAGIAAVVLLILYFGEMSESFKRNPGQIKWYVLAAVILLSFFALGFFLKRRIDRAGGYGEMLGEMKSRRTKKTFQAQPKSHKTPKDGAIRNASQTKSETRKGKTTTKKTLFGTVTTFKPSSDDASGQNVDGSWGTWEEMFGDALKKDNSEEDNRKESYVYVTCSCGQKLRFPAGRGQIEYKCPKCERKGTLYTGQKR